MISVLRSQGVRVQSAAAWVTEQFLLETLTDFTVRGIARLRQTGNKPWFETADKIPPGIGHGIHAVKLWRLAYGDSLRSMPHKLEDRYRLCAKALRLKPTSDPKFQTVSDMFWTVLLVLTDNGSISLFGKRHEAAYDGRYPYGIVVFPVFREKQNFGTPLNAEGTGQFDTYPISHQSVLHEFRHAFQDYANTEIHQQSRRQRAGEDAADDEESAERTYQLRPNEVDSRLAEFTRMIRFYFTNELKNLWVSHKPENEDRYYGGLKPHLDRVTTDEFTGTTRRMLLDHYIDTKRELAETFSSFARFRDFALTRLQRKHLNLYKFAYTDAADIPAANARALIESRLRELYDDFSTRYRTLIPTLKEAA